MHLVYESHTSENIVATNEQLKKLLDFLMKASNKPDVFLVSGALLKELDIPYDEDMNVTLNLSALLQTKSKRELKQQNNTVLLPQVRFIQTNLTIRVDSFRFRFASLL